ncbi:MAG TPA: C4-type zinc ribbon domain-containing protein [Syntrophorhabdales bacterium]|nr:C4-type zinc ribbon domain-containing protein [Syntrophorhabdales bacterium]
MIEELGTLCEMQKLDTQLIEHERKRAQGPRRIAEIEQDLQNAKEKLSKEKEVIEELDKERRRKEKELDDEKERIKKVQSKLYEIKTNKEYQAVLKETEAAQAANDKTEEEIILLLERIEELRKDYEASIAYVKKRDKEVEIEKKELEKEMTSVEAVVTELRKQRDALLKNVSKEAKARYHTLMEKRNGLAIVNVKNGVCLGCYMNIPPQLFIEVTKNASLISCPSCNRIFCYQEEE